MGDFVAIIISSVLSSLISSGVVTAVVRQYWKGLQDEKLEHLKAELTSQNDKLQNEQKHLAAQIETRFQWLHERRATAMLDIYPLLTSVRNLGTKALKGAEDGTSDEESNAIGEKLLHRLRVLWDSYERVKLLFPEDVAEKFDAFRGAHAFDAPMLRAAKDRSSATEKMAEQLASCDDLLKTIERDFRQLYGVEASLRTSLDGRKPTEMQKDSGAAP